MKTVFLDAGLWRLMSFSRARPFLVAGFWALMTAFAIWRVVTGISINTDSSDMISPKAPFRVAATEFKAAFPDLGDQVVVVVQSGTPDEASAFTDELAQRLIARDEVSALLAPPSEPFFKENGLLFLSVEELEDLLLRLTNAAPLIERLGPDPTLATLFDALAEAAEQGDSADPETLDALYAQLTEVLTTEDKSLSWETLLSPGEPPEAQVLFSLDPVLDYTKLKPAKAVKEAILQEADAVRSETGLEARVLITGDPVLRTEELEAVSSGTGLALGLSAIFVAILLSFAFRSARLVAATLVTIAVSVILTAGIAVALFGQLNLISVAFAVLMVGLGADFSIHLLIHIRDERAKGVSERAAGYRTSRMIGTALMLTAPTTALAFFSFAPTEFIGMNQLGVIAGFGVMTAFLVAVTLLPAVVKIGDGAKPMAELPEDRLRKIVPPAGLIVGGLGVASLFLLPWARFDADPMALRAKTAPSVIAFDVVVEDEKATPYRLNVLAESEDELLARAERLKAPASVDSVRHLFSFVPEEQDLKLSLIDAASVGLGFALIAGGDVDAEFEPAFARLMVSLRDEQGSRNAEKLRTVLEGMSPAALRAAEPRVFEFWPRQREALQQQLRANYVSVDDVPQVIRDRYVTEDGTYRLEIMPVGGAVELDQRRTFVEEVLEVAPDAAGSARTALSAGDVIGRAMVQASLTAAVLVSLLVLAVTRSFVVLLLLLIPLVLAGSLTTATGTLFGLPYNFANVLVLPLIIGIGIDSGIHLAFRAEKTGDALEAVRGSTGRAVLFSALTTIASFGSLIISDHRGTASMGALLTIGMLWVLATMLFALPPLAQFLYGRRNKISVGKTA
ncbi:MMPL family transporter [Parvularcula sp. ZS-1/3]|uniref:MMPL family transporter n=1 Tax=Parvularcula mediterranea TaxID=2732508 RepID=A0A7Y3RLC1_9PROT|nr:MMPL family transporter [Parvularcula mediterranea]NNU15705.1 MMPL family transporter [Parvularcula mediterranea]